MSKNILWLYLPMFLLMITGCDKSPDSPSGNNGSNLILPSPLYDSKISVEQALQRRRSVREYDHESLDLVEVSQLLWAAQGLTHPDGKRTSPSAGALYPLNIYMLTGDVDGIPAGVYRYRPKEHMLSLIVAGDKRQELFDVALQQGAVKDAAMVIAIGAVYERTTNKYDQRGIRYVHMEVGHVAQNIYLQAGALNLGTVFIGAFHDDEVKAVLQMGKKEIPLGLMPVGKK